MADDPAFLNRPLGDDDVVQLKRLAERKSRIDDQIRVLQAFPQVRPFEPVAPTRSDVSKSECEEWWRRHDQIEAEAVSFRGEELALMKKVAKTRTSHMSTEDTDLVEVTLKTLEAFSRLEHLLRTRRKKLEVLRLRLQWEAQMDFSWGEHAGLVADIPAFLAKARWQKPAPPRIAGSPRIRAGSSSSQFSTPTLVRPKRDSLLRSSSPILAAREGLPRLDSVSSLSGPPSDASASGNDGSPPRPPVELGEEAVTTPVRFPTHHRRMSSFSPSTTSPALGTPSAQSRCLRAQAVALQNSTINSRAIIFARAVNGAGKTMDRMLDCGLHIPDPFLDEQDALEAAVKDLRAQEQAKFMSEMVEQYKAADEVWWQQRAVEGDADVLAREVDAFLSQAVDTATADELDDAVAGLEARARQLYDDIGRGEPTGRKAGTLLLPTSDLHPDQSQTNVALLGTLRLGHSQMEDRVAAAKTKAETYRFAAETVERAARTQARMDAAIKRLLAHPHDLLHLPGRPDLLSRSCLAVAVDEASFDQERAALVARADVELANAKSLQLEAANVLVSLQRSFADPNIKRVFRDVTERLATESKRAAEVFKEEQKAMDLLKWVRKEWTAVEAVQSETARGLQALAEAVEARRWKRTTTPTQGSLPSSSLSVVPGLRRRIVEDLGVALDALRPSLVPTYAVLDSTFEQAQSDLRIGLDKAGLLDDLARSADQQRLSVCRFALDADAVQHSVETLRRSINGELDGALARPPTERGQTVEEIGEAAETCRRHVGALVDGAASRITFLVRESSPEHVLPIDLNAQDSSVRDHLNGLTTGLQRSLDAMDVALDLLRWAGPFAGLDERLREIDMGLDELSGSAQDLDLTFAKVGAQASKPPFLTGEVLDQLSERVQAFVEARDVLEGQVGQAEATFEGLRSGLPADDHPRATEALRCRSMECLAARSKLDELTGATATLSSRLADIRQTNSISRRHFELRLDWQATRQRLQTDADAVATATDMSHLAAGIVRKAFRVWEVSFHDQAPTELVDLPLSLPPRRQDLGSFRLAADLLRRAGQTATDALSALHGQKDDLHRAMLASLPDDVASLAPVDGKLSTLASNVRALGKAVRALAELLDRSWRDTQRHHDLHRRRLQASRRLRESLVALEAVHAAIGDKEREASLRRDLISTLAEDSTHPTSADGALRVLTGTAGALCSLSIDERTVRDVSAQLDRAHLEATDICRDLPDQDRLGPVPGQAELDLCISATRRAVHAFAAGLDQDRSRLQDVVALCEVAEGQHDRAAYCDAWTLDVARSTDASISSLKDVLGAVLAALASERDEISRLDDLLSNLSSSDAAHPPEDLRAAATDICELAGGIGRRVEALADKINQLETAARRLEGTAPSSCAPSFEGLRVILRHGDARSKAVTDASSQLQARARSLLERLTLRHETAMLDQIRSAVEAIDTNEWHGPSITEHSAMPEPRHVERLGRAIADVQASLAALNLVHPQSLLARDEVAALLRRRRSLVEACSAMCAVGQACRRCDDAFSRLLDSIDEADEVSTGDTQRAIEKLEAALDDGSGRMSVMRDACAAAPSDPRTIFHMSRLQQTWEELSAMAQEELERLRRPRPPVSQPSPDRRRTQSTLSTPPAGVLRSRRASAQPGPLRPPLSSGRSLSRISDYAPRSTGRTASYGGPGQMKRSPSNTSLASAAGRPRRSLASSTPNGARVARPNMYRPDPHRTIDKLVGSVVNRLPMQVDVKAFRDDGGADKTGRYWIGERLCFCRILRSQTVMVRIGGGWSELSKFIFDHCKHEFATDSAPSTPAASPAEERWISSDSLRRAAVAGNSAEDSPTLARKRAPSMLGLGVPQITTTPPEAIRLYMRPADPSSPSVEQQQRRRPPHWRP